MHIKDFVIDSVEFEAAMRDIDATLKAERPYIPGREIAAVGPFCERFRIDSLDLNHPVALRILDWFKTTYGERLNMDNVIGRTAVYVQGDLFILRCHLLYGRATCICSAEKMGQDLGPKLRSDGTKPVINILEHVTGLTKRLALRLSRADLNNMLVHYVAARDLFQNWGKRRKDPFLADAKADFDIAVDCLVVRKHYGLARWNYLQATEKALKSFIKQKNGIVKKTHHLATLSQDAKDLGLAPFTEKHIFDVQCSAEVRYDSSFETQESAHKAHLGAMVLISEVLYCLDPMHWTAWDAMEVFYTSDS